MFTLIRKLVQAFVLWLFGTLLSLIGFNAELPQQSDATIQGIRIIFCIAPILCMIAAVVVSVRYPVTPKTFKVVRNELDRLHAGGLKENADSETKRLCEKLTGHVYG